MQPQKDMCKCLFNITRSVQQSELASDFQNDSVFTLLQLFISHI